MNLQKLYEQSNLLLNERTSSILNFIRGLSAMLVVLNHFRNLFFTGFDSSSNILIIFLYSVASLGHQAVVVFFVLSGLFISNSVLKSIYNNKWSWKHYMTNRMTRLYVVLIPALVLGLLLDKVGMNLFDYSFYPHDMSERTNTISFLGNLFFLQGIYTEQFGSNDPLWSLSYEFWFYILFPIAVLTLFSKSTIKKVIGFIVFTVLLLFIGTNMSIYFIVWLCGALLLFMPKLAIRNKLTRIFIGSSITLSFFVGILLLRFEIVPIVIGDLLLAVSFTLLVWIILNIKSEFNLPRSFANASKVVADFSFTLYLIHFPIIIFLYALFREFGFTKFSNDVPSLMIAILLLIFIIGFSYVFSTLTEAKTAKIRGFIHRQSFKKSFQKLIPEFKK